MEHPGNSPNTPTPTSVATPPPPDPVTLACDKIFDAVKSEQYCQAMQAFEELQALDLERDDEQLPMITRAWGKALTGAEKLGSDEEHLAEIVRDFEDRFGFKSPYLQAFLIDEPNAAAAVETLYRKFGLVSFDAIDGVLDKHKHTTRTEIQQLLNLLRLINTQISPEISGKLQRFYVVRMKSEDPETVFAEMIADGLEPTSFYPYNMIFVKGQTRRPVMEYYDEMLDRGIKPDASTFRILVKNPQINKEEHAMLRRRLRLETQPEEKYMQMIRNCQNDGNWEEALRVVNRLMLEGMEPDKYVFNYLIMCCKRTPAQAEVFYKMMLDKGVQPNAVTFTNLITVSKDSKNSDSSERWLQEMASRGIQMDIHNYAALLDSYVKAGQRGRAMQMFKAVIEREDCGVAIYNTMMKLGPFDWALGCLACMLAEGLQPTGHTKSTIQYLARDDTSAELVDELHRCRWSKEDILRSDALVNPPRGTTPSLQDCMRLLLREIKTDDAGLAKRTAMLQREIAAANGIASS